MKKGIKFLTFIMSAFMLFSFCACSSEKSSGGGRFSGNVPGSVMELMYDVIGKDQATAEKMIGEFFSVIDTDFSSFIICRD